MSQTRIKTYTDLCDERERIKNLLVVQRQRIRDDWEILKDEFLPVKNAFGVVNKLTTADKSNPLVNAGLKLAGDVFLKNFILGKAGWITRLAVPFVVKNYSSHLLVEKGGSLLGKVMNIFKPKKKPYYYKKPGFQNFSAMDDKDNKVVNTEEQNRAVNPGTGGFQETSPKEHVGTNQGFSENSSVNTEKRDKPEKNPRVEE